MKLHLCWIESLDEWQSRLALQILLLLQDKNIFKSISLSTSFPDHWCLLDCLCCCPSNLWLSERILATVSLGKIDYKVGLGGKISEAIISAKHFRKQSLENLCKPGLYKQVRGVHTQVPMWLMTRGSEPEY